MADHVILVGTMGSGKTSVGGALARELGLEFIDLDQKVSAEHGPIPAIFAAGGEAAFRALEAQALLDALGAERAVIATGGGTVLQPGNRAAVTGRTVVYLRIDRATAAHRLAGDTNRPMLASGPDPLTAWERLAEVRTPVYQELATHTIDAGSGTPQQLAHRIAELLPGDPGQHHPSLVQTPTEEHRA